MQNLLKKYGIQGPVRLASADHADAKTLATILCKEHPQTIAVAIAHIETPKSGDILKFLPEALQVEVVTRIAKLELVSPEQIGEIDDAIADALRKMPPPGTKRFGGPEAVAKLLASMEPGLQKSMLERLKERNNELATDVESRLVTFEDVTKVPPRELQRLIPQFSTRDWAIALKNVGDKIRTTITTNMSERAAQNLKDEITSLPLMRISEVTSIQKKIIEAFKDAISNDDLV